MSRPRWATWITRISLVVGVAALVFTVYRLGPATIAHYVEHIGWWWFAVAGLEIAITTLDAIAIRAFLYPETLRFGAALLAQLSGRAVNAVTPSGNLGEAVKVSVLTEHVPQSRAVATVLLYNVVGFAMELVFVAAAAFLLVALVPLPHSLRDLMLFTCFVAALLAAGLFALVRRGLLGSLIGALRRMRLISEGRRAQWDRKLAPIDDQMKHVEGRKKIGISAIIASRVSSSGLSYLVFHAVGGVLTVRFIALTTVGGFLVYMLSTLVPMGMGISEGGYYGMFRAIGEDPARGVTMVLARRVTLVAYAAIGLVLMTLSETVQRARGRADTRTSPS